MTTRLRQREALVLLGAIALACFNLPPPARPCETDSDCEGPAICFADGCGDPGRDIKVQVSHVSTSTVQEFEVPELHATYDQQLRRPSTLSGVVSQTTTTGGTQPFSGKVTFKAVGSALFLPGVPRRAEATLMPDVGRFSLPLGSGLYSSVVAMGLDPTIPPVLVGDGRPLQVTPGDQPRVDVTFPHVSELIRISGVLLKTLASGPLSEPMEVLVLHPVSRRPMTQAQPVDPLTGAFTVLTPPEALSTGSPVLLLARPQGGASVDRIIPQHSFTITNPTVPLLLELGEFGLTVPVSGAVEDVNGGPVEGATVYIQGTAEGGGTFRSTLALTAAGSGTFSLRSLPSAAGDTITLWVIPPASSSAGRFQVEVVVPAQGGQLGTFRSPRRVPVRGEVRRPDGEEPAAGVVVRAEPVGGLPGSPPPSFSLQAVTDIDGRFTFLADPGEYRLDFVPADTLPKVSRRVRVESVLGGDGRPVPVEVPAFTLWNARKLVGTITGFATPTATEVTPLEGASVELWRVVWEDGKRVAYSLGQGTTDANGKYSVMLPTAPPALQNAPDGGSPDGGG